MYSAKETAAMTGLTTAALRYYEKEHLLPPIHRTVQRHRRYSDADIAWIKMIQCLRMAKVPIRSIRDYVLLLAQGGRTLPQRRGMVQAYMDTLQQQMSALQQALALAETKLAFYDELMQTPAAQQLSYLEEWKLFQNQEEDTGWTPF